jgi:dihydrofolate reductase
MRKLIVAMQVSLDGFIEGVDGDMSWRASDDSEEWADLFDMLKTVDLFLLGATMYPDYRNYWQQCLANANRCSQNEFNYAALAEKSAHIVFSTTLKDAGWANTRIIDTDVTTAIAAIKTQPGKDIHLVGGAKLAATAIEAGLVDEYRLNIIPVILGKGKSFFREQHSRFDLELISTKVLQSGVVIARYKNRSK